MRSLLSTLFGLSLLLVLAATPPQVRAQDQEPRLALVIGNANYKTAPLATPVNDAGLVAQTLQEAGFDVSGGADLDEDSLRNALRDFVVKVQAAGRDAVVFVYLAGRGLQYAGENYFVPVDAVVQREADVPVATVRLRDYTHALAAMPAKARIFVFDGARSLHFATEGNPFATGFALVDAEPGSLYAFNAAPGTIAPDEPGPYGIYAQALVEMMREGTPVDQVFADTRLRVNQLSGGAVVPWDVSKIDAPFFFFTRNPDAPPLQNVASLDNRPLSQFPVGEAYAIVVERDTIAGYEEFLAAYPRDPLALRVHALLAARREALTWRRALDANTPQAYWTYMRRYPHGPHIADARRRLAVLAAALDPPPRFDPYDFEGLPPPPDTDYMIVDQPVLIFNDPAFPPPPPPPVYLLPVRPVEFEHLPPPALVRPGLLPVPAPIPLQFSKPTAKKPGAIVQPSFGQIAPGGTPEQGKPLSGGPGKPLPGKLPEKSAASLGKPPLPERKHQVKPVIPEVAKPAKPTTPEVKKPRLEKPRARETMKPLSPKPRPEVKTKSEGSLRPALKRTGHEKGSPRQLAQPVGPRPHAAAPKPPARPRPGPVKSKPPPAKKRKPHH